MFNFIILCSLFLSAFSLKGVPDLVKTRLKRLPSENSSQPLEVKLGMYLESLGNFRSTEMTFDVDLYVYMSWKDERLAHNNSQYMLINDEEVRSHIWVPDLYFANAREAHFQEVTVPNFSMFVDSTGQVAYSSRCTLTVACSLDLRFYPMDEQLCSIRVVSYAYVARQMNVTWFDSNPIRYNPEIGLPEFEITQVSKDLCNGTYRYAMMPQSHKLDNFSCLAGQLFLSRSIGYNLVQSYIPTGLIVMISWVSFWIDRRAVPARVTLSFTTLVSLTTLGNGLRFGLPQVAYAKAIDLWYGACMLFVFCALLEFAIINSYMRKAEKFDQLAKRMNLLVMSMRRGQPPTPLLNDRKTCINGDVKATESPRYIDDQTSRTINFKNTLGTEILLNRFKRNSPRNDSVRYIHNDYDTRFNDASTEENKGLQESMESGGATSIYDNVTSPWKDFSQFKQSLMEESSKDSEDDSWPETKAKMIFDAHRGSTTTDAPTFNHLSKSFSRQALFIDKLCRYGFPLTFLAWNGWYWWYYLVYNAKKYAHNTV